MCAMLWPRIAAAAAATAVAIAAYAAAVLVDVEAGITGPDRRRSHRLHEGCCPCTTTRGKEKERTYSRRDPHACTLHENHHHTTVHLAWKTACFVERSRWEYARILRRCWYKLPNLWKPFKEKLMYLTSYSSCSCDCHDEAESSCRRWESAGPGHCMGPGDVR